MNSIVESFTELGTTTLDQVVEAQGRVLEWNRQMAETAVPRLAAMPGAEAIAGQNMASDWIEASFKLTSKALEANTAFVKGLVDAWTIKPGSVPETPAPAAKTTAKS